MSLGLRVDGRLIDEWPDEVAPELGELADRATWHSIEVMSPSAEFEYFESIESSKNTRTGNVVEVVTITESSSPASWFSITTERRIIRASTSRRG